MYLHKCVNASKRDFRYAGIDNDTPVLSNPKLQNPKP